MRKLILLLSCLICFSSFAFASTETPYDSLDDLKVKPGFGNHPWEKQLEKESKEYKEKVKAECKTKQKKIILLKKKKQEEEKRRKEEEKRKRESARLLKEQAETQDKYTNAENEKTIKDAEGRKWKSIGSKRITHYCPMCNTPRGSYASSSGKKLYEGAAACSWLPLGSIIKVNGKIYTIIDRCGTSAIDIFHDTPSSCLCNQAGSYNANVYVCQ